MYMHMYVSEGVHVGTCAHVCGYMRTWLLIHVKAGGSYGDISSILTETEPLDKTQISPIWLVMLWGSSVSTI